MRSRNSPPAHEVVAERLAAVRAEWDTAGAASSTARGTAIRPRPPTDSDDDPIEIPVPGRHARRRLVSTLPPGLRGRYAVSAAHLAVIAVVVAAALGVLAWWQLRSTPEVVAPAPLVQAGAAEPLVTVPPTSAGSDSAHAAAQNQAEVVVDVAGKVRRPGIAVLPAGSRVVDALKAAGGARRGVALASLNLARPLVDGEQILVGAAPAQGPPSGAAVASPGGSLVSLNTADQVTLETLPGVGPVTAQAILSWRDNNGGFTTVDQLLEVNGIGDATLAKLAPLVTL